MPSRKTIANQIWWQLGIFLVVSTAAAVIGVHFKEKFARFVPENLSNPSAMNKKPSGSSGFYELTKLVGLKSYVWKLPYRDLKSVKGQLVIVGPKESLSKLEIDEVMNWVSAGNDLVYLDQFSNPYSKSILQPLSLFVFDAGAHQNVQALTKAELPVTRFVGIPVVSYVSSFQVGNGTPILKAGNDIVLMETHHGAGRVLIGTTANLIANANLAKNGANFQLLANWLRLNDRPVYFDERSHGLTQGKNLISTIFSGTTGILLVELLIIFTLAVASAAQRFGQRLTRNNQRKISNLEFVSGIANSYRRAKATNLASEVLSHNLKMKLGKFLGQSTSDDQTLAIMYWQMMAEAKNVKSTEDDKSRLINTLAFAGTKDARISAQELAEIAAYCDKIQETLETKRQATIPNKEDA